MRRISSFFVVVGMAMVVLAGCSKESASNVKGSSTSSLKNWTQYKNDKGFTVMLPPKWKVEDLESRGISLFNPANDTTQTGGTMVRLDQQILFKTGKTTTLADAMSASENSGCGKKSKAKIGEYDAFAVTCTNQTDGVVFMHFFVQRGDDVFHFISRSDKKTNGNMKKIRDSIVFTDEEEPEDEKMTDEFSDEEEVPDESVGQGR